MKITKITAGVFFLAFLIGYALVPQTKQAPPKTLVDVPEVLPGQQIETKAALNANEELETIKEIDNGIEEDKYPFKIKLLETGDGFRGREVKAKSGETWLGLFSEKGKHILRFTKIKIGRVHDGIVDGRDERMKTGKSVSVKSAKQPVFLLKDANILREGEVTTLFRGLTWNEILEDENSTLTQDQMFTNLTNDFMQKYKIGGKNYTLNVVEAKNENNERILALVLESGGTRQILHTMNIAYNSGVGTLYWVGDLDRDEKPDFYLNLFVHENVENRVLLLSSKAEKGRLVKKAAYFWTTGC